MRNQTTNNLFVLKPLLMYFILCFAFFWLLLALAFYVLFGLLQLRMDDFPIWVVIAIPILGSWIPSLAAAIITGVCQGPKGVRQLFERFLQFRFLVCWYLAALIPAGITFMAVGIYRFTGGVTAGSANASLAFGCGNAA